MWLITNFGFFSVVQKPDDPKLGTLTVRSRVLEDLESLKEQYFKQTMGEIQVNAGTDYKYRAKVPREAMAGAMSQIIMELNYSNFKNSVAENQGYKRASVYSKLWDTLYNLQDPDEIDSDNSLNTSKEKQSFGGILIDKDGQILLRKPAGEYDGYVAEPRACEWDIAAGHALLENAGGKITDFEGNEILYGKENFKNPSLILKRSEDLKY